MAYIALNRLDSVPEKIQDYPEFSMFGELPAWAFYVRHANGISFKNIKVSLDDTDFRPAFVFDDVQNLKMEQIDVPKEKTNQIVLKSVSESKIDLDEKIIKTINN